MKLVDRITIMHGNRPHHIELLVGDLADIPPEHAVDALVVSAFPDDYSPTENSLIGALFKRGISVGDLALDKQIDLRENFSCWLSKEITSGTPRPSFKRLLCFEPIEPDSAPDLVRGIFQALACFTFGEPDIRSIALPVVAAGDQGNSISKMLPPLMEFAVRWLQIGYPLDTIKFVVRSETSLAKATPLFKAGVKFIDNLGAANRVELPSGRTVSIPKDSDKKSSNFDVFISYSREDESAAKALESVLTSSGFAVFRDLTAMEVGDGWQQKIYDALEKCAAAAILLSPAFLSSKMCKEEFNIAKARQRDLEDIILFPMLVRDAALPTYMRLTNYTDCRINDPTKISVAAEQLIRRLRKA